MHTYYSTFISGFGEIVQQELQAQTDDVVIESIFDGIVMYKTKSSIQIITAIPFFNNSYLLLKYYSKLGKNPVNEMLAGALDDSEMIMAIEEYLPHKDRSFRIMAREENQYVAMDKELQEEFESNILAIGNLRIDRSNPDYEFEFLSRKEGNGFFGMRLTRHASYDKTLQKGELRPELTYMLCLISEPKHNDIFLDPFCGSSSIAKARKLFSYEKIHSCDKNLENYCDALHLTDFADSSITKIVTDPPWGLYKETEIALPDFYTRMLNEFSRVLTENGIVVILTAQKEIFENILKTQSNFELLKTYNILVSGKKAGVYRLRKIS